MRAIILKEPGDANQLIIEELAMPVIGDQEVLVQVNSIGINPIDVKTRNGKGMYERIKEDSPIVLGWDVSGVVTDSKSSLFNTGDEVFGMVNFPGHGKAYAEYVRIPETQLSLKPKNISHDEAAGASLAALTAWQALIDHATIKPGDKVLIHAASGGVGHFAVQFAKHLGAFVIGTSSAKHRDFVLSLGADLHIDYKSERFEDVLDKDIAFVLDPMGGDMIDRSLEVIIKGGTIASLPSASNEAVVEKAAEKGVNGKRIMVQSNGKDMKAIAALLEKGIVKSHISEVFSFEEIAAAHLQIESGRTVGKIVVGTGK